ncbi:hypothetical protein ANN_21655 [Periplaneta americana]|uniref:Uncharacterized protein n=1 Tax=Periplaneta americana TaxID=6978 RepID=A0ABQ8S6P3_PERAM|nr:hypothetical protein ANN_21655 [Periplaneta americana]
MLDFFTWSFNDTVSTTRLFSVDGIGDSEMIFTSEKTQPGNQPKRESNPRPYATPDRQTSALADRATPVAPFLKITQYKHKTRFTYPFRMGWKCIFTPLPSFELDITGIIALNANVPTGDVGVLEGVKWTDRIRNETVIERIMLKLNQEEENKLAGSLAVKKLPIEGCTGRNGEREKSSRKKKSDKGDNAGEMRPGSSTESYPAFAHIGLKEPQPGNLLRPGIEPEPPGFAARRADRYSTAIDCMYA